jgi:predicted negative regulator of RcsB-dependent stress response
LAARWWPCQNGAPPIGGYSRAALEQLRLALATFRTVRDRMWEARSWQTRGDVLAATGDQERARSCWRRALDRFTELDSPEAAEVRTLLDAIP